MVSHTDALAHNNRPPMGAKMTPTMKKSGRTLFGVRMGLRVLVDAMGPFAIADEDTLPGFQALLPEGCICIRVSIERQREHQTGARGRILTCRPSTPWLFVDINISSMLLFAERLRPGYLRLGHDLHEWSPLGI